MINHQSAYRSQRGFTLIETVIYLTLFSILFSGILISAYTLITSAEYISLHVAAENESAFVVRKINTLLVSANSITKPTQDTTDTTLTFSTYAGNEYSVTINNGVATLTTNGGDAIPLTLGRIAFTTFSINHKTATNGTPRYVEYSFTVNDKIMPPVRNYFTF